MNCKGILLFVTLTFFVSEVFAQSEQNGLEEGQPNEQAIFLLFVVAIAFVIGIGLYISREIILRKKTDYDTTDAESKKDRDYEKYHSDWSEEGSDFESKESEKNHEEFEKNPDGPNYYETLGVPTDATQDEIKKRYRSLAKELHPDKSKDEETQEQMAKINEAYEVLSDVGRKEKYDKFLNLT